MSRTDAAAAEIFTLETRSAEETQAVAAALAAAAEPGDRIALIGPLGAGKTQFAKGFAVGLGIGEVVNSPSFALMSEYEGRLPFFHQDLYRLAGTDEALGGGLLDERQDDGVTLTEWAERLDGSLDPERVTISLEPTGETTRRLALAESGAAFERYSGAARAVSVESMTGRSGALILAIDTATRSSAVAVGTSDEAIEATIILEARHRHGSVLLEQIDDVLSAAGISLDDVDAMAVGTGPGSFTGMRVGLATAKTIAYVRRLPIVGVPSASALRAAAVRGHAAPADIAIVLPAGAHDHYLALPDEDVRLVPPGELAAMLEHRPALSVDMATDVLGGEAATTGALALDGLAAALLGLAAERLAAGVSDDIEALVPAYVALPRGVRQAAEDLGWSPDLR